MGCGSVSLGRGLARFPLDCALTSVADTGLNWAGHERADNHSPGSLSRTLTASLGSGVARTSAIRDFCNAQLHRKKSAPAQFISSADSLHRRSNPTATSYPHPPPERRPEIFPR